ncbi:hypothetical protein E1J38_013605 [Seonamhaeicola sediminis]|uniref:Lipoprotein n=1 Tax=Seonamhaeicola sediminis TaxID=2528206 RepID=A0A562YBI4_9FLAO|nr:hypothetical protein [Seonamhaeicola sediminis]TWO31445.1 hypothetical protein E1J38_013605 [Seonamhaeicola sediminis]
MNSITKHLKLIAIILITPFLVQSCTIYKSANVSLEEAAKSESKTKIVKKDGKREKYSKVLLLDSGELYGVNWVNRKQTTDSIFIDAKTVKKVKLENKKLNSNIEGVIWAISWIGGLTLAIVYVYPWMFGV